MILLREKFTANDVSWAGFYCGLIFVCAVGLTAIYTIEDRLNKHVKIEFHRPDNPPPHVRFKYRWEQIKPEKQK